MVFVSPVNKINQSISKIHCAYINSTPQMQFVRVVDRQARKLELEKTIFPLQRTILETSPEGQLEVYINRQGKLVLDKSLLCRELKVGRSRSNS